MPRWGPIADVLVGIVGSALGFWAAGLLGHRSGRITTHYSGAELSKLIESANQVSERGPNARPELVVLRRLSVS